MHPRRRRPGSAGRRPPPRACGAAAPPPRPGLIGRVEAGNVRPFGRRLGAPQQPGVALGGGDHATQHPHRLHPARRWPPWSSSARPASDRPSRVVVMPKPELGILVAGRGAAQEVRHERIAKLRNSSERTVIGCKLERAPRRSIMCIGNACTSLPPSPTRRVPTAQAAYHDKLFRRAPWMFRLHVHMRSVQRVLLCVEQLVAIMPPSWNTSRCMEDRSKKKITDHRRSNV